MTLAGIIANPAASKDIRRLVALGRVIPDWEKVNTVRRVMLGLQAVGVDAVVAMADSAHLCERARDYAQLELDLSLLPIPSRFSERDTTRAAAAMKDLGVGCLVTLGGDGTNRAVAKGCTSIPVVAISTGTNNVFPAMVEGTLAGMAAGLVALGKLDEGQVATRSKMLEVYVDEQYRDVALVDVALSRERFVASRAIWDLETLYEVFLTRAEPFGIGLSAVGGQLAPTALSDDAGLRYVLGSPERRGNTRIVAPVAPGVVTQVDISSFQKLELGEPVHLERRHCTVALDGEREFAVTPGEGLSVLLRRNGPPVVDVGLALKTAAQQGVLRLS